MLRVRLPSCFHDAATGWHRALLAGLTLLAACLLAACLLADDGRPSRPAPLPCVAAAPQTLVVIVDGLRVDEAADASRMPFVASLPQRSVAAVECELPSSTAAITTWTTGRVPSLRSFLRDFSTRPEPRGGLLEHLHAAGQPAFIVGPTLWTGRFGRWIEGVGDTSWGVADQARFEHARHALTASPRRLTLVHFDGLDRAGHRGEPIEPRLRELDRWIATLAATLRPDGVLLVTSDHGRTASGGHAGLESSVTRTPLLANANVTLPAATTQAATAALLADLTATPRPPASDADRLGRREAIALGTAVVGFAAAVALLLVDCRRPTPTVGAAFGCGTGFAFAALVLGWFAIAVAVGAGVAAWGLWRFGGCRPSGSAVAIGVAVAVARLAGVSISESIPWDGVMAFIAGTVAACGLIAALPRETIARLPVVATLAVAVPALQCQTASLSTIQTTLGFRLMELGGPAAGVLLTIALHGLPWWLLGGRLAATWQSGLRLPAGGFADATTLAGSAMLTVAGCKLFMAAATPLLVRMLCELSIIGLGGGAALLLAATLEWSPRPTRPVASPTQRRTASPG